MDEWDTVEEVFDTDAGAGCGVFEWESHKIDLRERPISDICEYSNYRSWQSFLLLATLLVSGLLAGGLSLITFQHSSAKTSFQQTLLELNPASLQISGSNDQQEGNAFVLVGQTDQSLNCQVSSYFPNNIRRWCDTISQYANKRGLPADLVAAVILQESGGDPDAFSQSGAVGLMQVMPRDGPAASFMCVNGPCFSSRPSSQELRNPDFNVSYGTKMLSGLVRKHGDIREALKSYGPMDVGYAYADKVLGIYQRYGD